MAGAVGRFDLPGGILHIRQIKIFNIIGDANDYYNIGLRYLPGSNPVAFTLDYVEKPLNGQNCTVDYASLNNSGILTIPSLRFKDSNQKVYIFNNVIFKLKSATIELQSIN